MLLWTLSPMPSHNVEAGMLLPTQEDPFTPLQDRWEGKGQSETGFYLRERLWTDVGGVISTLALPFASTTVLRVRSANPFNAGVGRRRSRCGVAWANQPIVSWKGHLCQVFQLRHPQMRDTTPSSFSSTIRMPTLPISCHTLSLWEEHHRTVSLR